MPYQADVFKVMIASPSDVAKEKQLAREVVHEWNDLHSEQVEIVLLPISWETHSTPEMGDRPQAIINKQMLKDTDLLIGIFWTRIGTPTGEAESGTVEEIKEHIKADKPAMIYFSKQPAALDSVDQDQYKKLKTFIEECKAMGILFEYDNLSQFKEYLYRHLVQKINGHEYFKNNITKNNMHKESISLEMIEKANRQFLKTDLSSEAKELIIEASKSSDGIIMKLRTMGGLTIQTNSKNFIGKRDARHEAIWIDAIKQLIENGFIEERGHKGEVFAVTRLGYDYSDELGKEV